MSSFVSDYQGPLDIVVVGEEYGKILISMSIPDSSRHSNSSSIPKASQEDWKCDSAVCSEGLGSSSHVMLGIKISV